MGTVDVVPSLVTLTCEFLCDFGTTFERLLLKIPKSLRLGTAWNLVPPCNVRTVKSGRGWGAQGSNSVSQGLMSEIVLLDQYLVLWAYLARVSVALCTQ